MYCHAHLHAQPPLFHAHGEGGEFDVAEDTPRVQNFMLYNFALYKIFPISNRYGDRYDPVHANFSHLKKIDISKITPIILAAQNKR